MNLPWRSASVSTAGCSPSPCSWFSRAGDGLFGLGRHGARAFRVALRFSLEAIDLGRRRTRRDGRHHALDYRRYKHPALVFSLMGVTTLLLISVFFLDRSHNTHRWIHAGGFSFQPSELAKPVLILFLAYFLESRAKAIDDCAQHAAARRCASTGVSRTDRAAARSRHRHRLRRNRRLHPLCCRHAHALFRLRLRRSLAAALFSDFSRGLPPRPHPRLPQSLRRPPEGAASTSFSR